MRVVVYALLIVFAIIYLGPLLMLLNTSLKTMPEFMKNATAPATSVHLQNFADAWTKANFPRYLTNTLLYTVSATIIYVVAAVFVAFPIVRELCQRRQIPADHVRDRLFLPVALIPQFQLMLTLGLYNNPLGYVMLFLVNPIGIIILVAYMKTLPKDLDEAAVMDGCGYLRDVVQVVFP